MNNMIKWKERITNPWFYVAVIATIMAAAGIDVETLTTWELLKDAMIALLMNPFRLGTVVVALLGDWYNPTTKGLSD